MENIWVYSNNKYIYINIYMCVCVCVCVYTIQVVNICMYSIIIVIWFSYLNTLCRPIHRQDNITLEVRLTQNITEEQFDFDIEQKVFENLFDFISFVLFTYVTNRLPPRVF